MFSIIEVQCPHCGVHGQMLVPPLGALIVGPCPNCNEFVMIFCGRVLALQKEIILDGPTEEKRAHIMQVLITFLEERVWKVVDRLPSEESSQDWYENPSQGHVGADRNVGPISQVEVNQFLRLELPQVDHSGDFRDIFGS